MTVTTNQLFKRYLDFSKRVRVPHVLAGEDGAYKVMMNFMDFEGINSEVRAAIGGNSEIVVDGEGVSFPSESEISFTSIEKGSAQRMDYEIQSINPPKTYIFTIRSTGYGQVIALRYLMFLEELEENRVRQEPRTVKLQVNKVGGTAGKDAVKFKVQVPAPWIRDMGLNINERDIDLSYDDVAKEVTIKRREG